jgi:hypothetical protein
MSAEESQLLGLLGHRTYWIFFVCVYMKKLVYHVNKFVHISLRGSEILALLHNSPLIAEMSGI